MQHRLSCLEACGILVPPPGIKPPSLALEGGFSVYIYPFIFGCAEPSLLFSRCTSFSLQGLLLLWGTGGRPQGLWLRLLGAEHRLSSCDTRASLLRSMWDLPKPGVECMSPALAGGFFPTEPPAKPQKTDS